MIYACSSQCLVFILPDASKEYKCEDVGEGLEAGVSELSLSHVLFLLPSSEENKLMQRASQHRASEDRPEASSYVTGVAGRATACPPERGYPRGLQLHSEGRCQGLSLPPASWDNQGYTGESWAWGTGSAVSILSTRSGPLASVAMLQGGVLMAGKERSGLS